MSGPGSTAEIERLLAELETLRESEEKHKLLIETTDTGFVILDETGRVLDANAVYVRLSGHERLDQILGRPVTDWTAPEDVARNAQEVRRCLAQGAVRNLEIGYVGADGALTPIEINATVRRSPGGTTIFTVCREISDRKRTEEALRNSEQRYRTTIDSMGEFIHVVDADLRIVLVNRTGEQWLRQLGITQGVVGQRVFEAFPFLAEQVREEYRRVFEGEGPLITSEANLVGAEEVTTETRKIPIIEGGRVVRVVTVIRDVTEGVRVQERLRQSEKMEALGQLAGGIAHDFNNQLAAMLGYAELLARRLEQPQLREYATAIARIAERSADLTRQLLAFARRERALSVPVDVHALLREVEGMLGRTVDPRIAIVCRLDADRARTVGDPGQLQSAFLNLALNARDAMPEGGQLSFATDVVLPGEAAGGHPDWVGAGPCLRVRVCDTGVGMTDEVRRRLFEPFFTTKGLGHGTGMGLAAVYGTISNHQGAILVESEPGRGSTFTVLLPLAGKERPSEALVLEEAPARGKGHVLVADDEPDVLRTTCEALSDLGYTVTACADGAAAVERFREAQDGIDLVLLDVMMPALGGSAALAQMRRIDPAVRAILCSGHPLGPEERRLIDEQGVLFMGKPFTMAELARCAAAALGHQVKPFYMTSEGS